MLLTRVFNSATILLTGSVPSFLPLSGSDIGVSGKGRGGTIAVNPSRNASASLVADTKVVSKAISGNISPVLQDVDKLISGPNCFNNGIRLGLRGGVFALRRSVPGTVKGIVGKEVSGRNRGEPMVSKQNGYPSSGLGLGGVSPSLAKIGCDVEGSLPSGPRKSCIVNDKTGSADSEVTVIQIPIMCRNAHRKAILPSSSADAGVIKAAAVLTESDVAGNNIDVRSSYLQDTVPTSARSDRFDSNTAPCWAF